MLLVEKLTGGLSKNSVRIIQASLRAMLNAAVDGGAILANPADTLGRSFHVVRSTSTCRGEIKTLTRDQFQTFLAYTTTGPRHAALFLLMARTDLRLGGALAFGWDDRDFPGREIRMTRAFSAGAPDSPKASHGRSVDISQQLALALLRLQNDRKAEAVRREWLAVPPLALRKSCRRRPR